MPIGEFIKDNKWRLLGGTYAILAVTSTVYFQMLTAKYARLEYYQHDNYRSSLEIVVMQKALYENKFLDMFEGLLFPLTIIRRLIPLILNKTRIPY